MPWPLKRSGAAKHAAGTASTQGQAAPSPAQTLATAADQVNARPSSAATIVESPTTSSSAESLSLNRRTLLLAGLTGVAVNALGLTAMKSVADKAFANDPTANLAASVTLENSLGTETSSGSGAAASRQTPPNLASLNPTTTATSATESPLPNTPNSNSAPTSATQGGADSSLAPAPEQSGSTATDSAPTPPASSSTTPAPATTDTTPGGNTPAGGSATAAASVTDPQEALAITRLLRRLGLGVRPGEYEAALAAGLPATIERLLAIPAQDAGVVATPPPELAYLASFSGTPQSEQINSTIDWWLRRLVLAEHGTSERMTWFWHGHWATNRSKVTEMALMLAQNQSLRRHALGDFRAMAREMITDAALIKWLDGQTSRKGSPNENLAREFMELFTIGVGNYTETDVHEAARALTGWQIAAGAGNTPSRAVLNPTRFDSGSKTILGQSGNFGALELADLLASKQSCPLFLARRLWHRFVSSSQPMPIAAQQTVATAFGPERSIGAAMRALVQLPAWQDPTYELVSSPVEWYVAACRALAVDPASSSQRSQLRSMGQIAFEPPSVGGWPADLAWLTTGAMGRRISIATAIASKADLSWLTPVAPADRGKVIAHRLGIPSFHQHTDRALALIPDGPIRVVTVALLAPEFVVSR